jgi:hypothetical protein
LESYLLVEAGRIRILLNAINVRDVIDGCPGGAGDEAAGYRLWRGQILPVKQLRELIGLERREVRVTVVYSGQEDGQLVLLDVDCVTGLRRIDKSEWSSLPPLPDGVGGLFDWLVTDNCSGIQLMHLRDGVLAG